jgi:hypothetical protein
MVIPDYSGQKSAKNKILVFNPNPYPVTATMEGHTIGGREAAYVWTGDWAARSLLKDKVLEVSEEWIVLGIAQPSTD